MQNIEFKLAQQSDLPRIVEIYNQTIESRHITSDLEPVTVEQRRAWFDAHSEASKNPIWVIQQSGKVVGWCSYSVFYGRIAYAQTTEVTIYLDQQIHHQGLGTKTIDFLKSQMATYEKKTLLAFVFKGNTPSIQCFKKNGFAIWGEFPNVADMGPHHETLCILGYQPAERGE